MGLLRKCPYKKTETEGISLSDNAGTGRDWCDVSKSKGRPRIAGANRSQEQGLEGVLFRASREPILQSLCSSKPFNAWYFLMAAPEHECRLPPFTHIWSQKTPTYPVS